MVEVFLGFGSIFGQLVMISQRQELLECVLRVSDLMAESVLRFVGVSRNTPSGAILSWFGVSRLEGLLRTLERNIMLEDLEVDVADGLFGCK